jgi:hypothetical protein
MITMILKEWIRTYGHKFAGQHLLGVWFAHPFSAYCVSRALDIEITSY